MTRRAQPLTSTPAPVAGPAVSPAGEPHDTYGELPGPPVPSEPQRPAPRGKRLPRDTDLSSAAPSIAGDGVDAAFREMDRSRRMGWARAFAAERRQSEATPAAGPSVAVTSAANHDVIDVTVTGWARDGHLGTAELYLSEQQAAHLAETLLTHLRRSRRIGARGADFWTTTLSWPETEVPRCRN